MKIESVEFVISAGNLSQCPGGTRAEFALSGRSNVGKSSLLNSLVGRKSLALVSSTPGKTQRLNYFLVNGDFHLVDLPGYGYARTSASASNRWRELMQEYLRTRRQLTAVVQLVDSRHAPSREDREMVQWLRGEKLRFCLVPTKTDKLRQGERQQALRVIARDLELPATQVVVPYSSHTGEGRGALLAWIGQALAPVSET